MTTAHDDQVQAAASHAERVLRKAGDELGWTPSSSVSRDFHWKLLMLAVKAGQCPHLESPQVCWLWLGDPSIIRCGSCVHEVLEGDYPNPDQCDVCERVTATFREMQVQMGPLLISGNICDTCSDESGMRKAD